MIANRSDRNAQHNNFLPPPWFFRSQDINLAPHRASEIVLIKTIFDSKRDAAGDDTSSGYSSFTPTTVSLTLNGSDFSRN